MQNARSIVLMLLFFCSTNFRVYATEGEKTEERILGKWKIQFEEKFGKDKDVPFFLTYEFLKDAKAKMTFTLGEPAKNEQSSLGKYKLLDEATIEIEIVPPGMEKSITEQFTIDLLTSDKLGLRAKGEKNVLTFSRIK